MNKSKSESDTEYESSISIIFYTIRISRRQTSEDTERYIAMMFDECSNSFFPNVFKTYMSFSDMFLEFCV